MIVITGPMRVVSRFSASRRSRPRWTASAAANACATLNETVALMLTPRYVASSIASIPARVAGSLTMTFGASPSNTRACATSASASRHSVGSVWIERRPARPPEAAKAGMSSGAARTLISATIAQASVALGPGRVLPGQDSDPSGPHDRVAAPVVDDDRRVGGGAHGAELDGVPELVDVAAVVPDVGGRLGDGAAEGRIGQCGCHC